MSTLIRGKEIDVKITVNGQPVDLSGSWKVLGKYGASAAALHGELVGALSRVANPLSADQLRRVVQELICGKFHGKNVLPKERKRLLIDSLDSIPHCAAIGRWRADLVRRIRHGSYVEA